MAGEGDKQCCHKGGARVAQPVAPDDVLPHPPAMRPQLCAILVHDLSHAHKGGRAQVRCAMCENCLAVGACL